MSYNATPASLNWVYAIYFEVFWEHLAIKMKGEMERNENKHLLFYHIKSRKSLSRWPSFSIPN